MIPILPGVADLADKYDVWFCDIWGVMHNGSRAKESAVRACEKFRGNGGIVVLITNAPRPFHSVADQLAGFGVPASAYDAIVSSGDVTHHMITEKRGQAIHHIGPARDAPIIERAKIDVVELERADAVLLTGLNDDVNEVPQDYRPLLERLLVLQLPIICANPDLMVECGDRLVYCAGAIAAVYEEMGGQVHYAGKPYAPIYEMALQAATQLGERAPDRSKILCIGDGLETDMAGAFRAGIDALYVASAVHVEEALTLALVDALFKDAEGRPIGAMEKLAW